MYTHLIHMVLSVCTCMYIMQKFIAGRHTGRLKSAMANKSGVTSTQSIVYRDLQYVTFIVVFAYKKITVMAKCNYSQTIPIKTAMGSRYAHVILQMSKYQLHDQPCLIDGPGLIIALFIKHQCCFCMCAVFVLTTFCTKYIVRGKKVSKQRTRPCKKWFM